MLSRPLQCSGPCRAVRVAQPARAMADSKMKARRGAAALA
jgi:hypothetical protein